jgi:DNA-binding NarL/FixJ family response regulator
MDSEDQVDMTEVERRVIRALKTVRVLPDREARFQRYQNAWPAYIQEYIDAYAAEEERFPRFRPTPFDVSDMLTALGWMNVLTKNDKKIVIARSYGVSFKQIASRIGRSDETARRRYRDVMIRLWAEANGYGRSYAA